MRCTFLIVLGVLVAMVQGEDTADPTVIHATDAVLGERPYQVIVYLRGRHQCSGSIVNAHWVVTTADCIANSGSPSDITINAGTVNVSDAYSVHNVSQTSQKNDIALIKVATPFEFSSRIKAVVMPDPQVKIETNSSAVISGWKYTEYTNNPGIMKKETVYTSDQKVCEKTVEEAGEKDKRLWSSLLCANDLSSRDGECIAESGSPLTIDGVLAGIMIWDMDHQGCGSPDRPNAYVRVSEYVDWIDEQIRK